MIGALAVVLVAKPARRPAAGLGDALSVQSRADGRAVALAQIGEFSFILATIGRELGILTTEATNALVATSIVSIVLNPVAYRTDPADRALARERARGSGRF